MPADVNTIPVWVWRRRWWCLGEFEVSDGHSTAPEQKPKSSQIFQSEFTKVITMPHPYFYLELSHPQLPWPLIQCGMGFRAKHYVFAAHSLWDFKGISAFLGSCFIDRTRMSLAAVPYPQIEIGGYSGNEYQSRSTPCPRRILFRGCHFAELDQPATLWCA